MSLYCYHPWNGIRDNGQVETKVGLCHDRGTCQEPPVTPAQAMLSPRRRHPPVGSQNGRSSRFLHQVLVTACIGSPKVARGWNRSWAYPGHESRDELPMMLLPGACSALRSQDWKWECVWRSTGRNQIPGPELKSGCWAGVGVPGETVQLRSSRPWQQCSKETLQNTLLKNHSSQSYSAIVHIKLKKAPYKWFLHQLAKKYKVMIG